MGFITEAQEEEIRQRRAKGGEEEDRLKAIQQSREADNLDQWKSARDSGAIKTASSGLKRDAAKMPYIDRGYVQETTSDGIPIKKKQESAPAAPNPFAGFQNPFEKKEAAAPAPAPAPSPSAPELPNPFAAFFDKPKTPEPEPAPEPEAPNPFEAFGKMFGGDK